MGVEIRPPRRRPRRGRTAPNSPDRSETSNTRQAASNRKRLLGLLDHPRAKSVNGVLGAHQEVDQSPHASRPSFVRPDRARPIPTKSIISAVTARVPISPPNSFGLQPVGGEALTSTARSINCAASSARSGVASAIGQIVQHQRAAQDRGQGIGQVAPHDVRRAAMGGLKQPMRVPDLRAARQPHAADQTLRRGPKGCRRTCSPSPARRTPRAGARGRAPGRRRSCNRARHPETAPRARQRSGERTPSSGTRWPCRRR